MNWWLICMKKYVDFNGRARRKEFWMFFLFNYIFGFVAFTIDNIFGIASEYLGFGWFFSLLSLAIILPSWAVLVRRLHDVGKSGWWMLISLIPFIGGLLVFVQTVYDSQVGDNEYGPNPKEVKLIPGMEVEDA